MASDDHFFPIQDSVDEYWPGDALEAEGDNPLEKVWISPLIFEESNDYSTVEASASLLFEEALTLNVGFIDGLSISLGEPDIEAEIPISATISNISEEGTFDTQFTVGPVPFRISFRNDLLVPATKNTSTDPPTFTRNEDEGIDITIGDARVIADLNGDFDVDFDSTVSLAPVFIGDTGVVIEADSVTPYFSANAAPPAGKDQGWRGVVIDGAHIYLPEGLSDVLPDDIELTDTYIGNGGFSGTVTGNWESSPQSKTLCGMTFSIKSARIEFKQNTIVDFSLKGKLTIPFFDGPVNLEVGLSNDGEFAAAIDTTDGLASVPLANLGTLSLTALGLGSEDNEFYIELSGTLLLDAGLISGVDLSEISVDGLRITSDARISLSGGGITLDVQEVVDLYAFQLEIESIGFGSENSENYVSFSGGVKLPEGLPASVSAEGLRVWWKPGGGVRVTLNGVGVSFEIPDVLSFEGEVSLTETQFEGAIELKLLAIDLAISAELVVGEASSNGTSFKYFYIELDAELPCGIPLAATGLALYGFSGLAIKNMVPNADSGQSGFSWYDDWYAPDGITKDKFEAEEGAFGFGVGTTVGTLPDNGLTFATKVALMILFPGPIVALEGIGNILRQRSKLEEGETLFDALLVFDGSAKTLSAGLGLQYELPSDGSSAGYILDAGGTAEALFDFDDADNWHIYLGEEPDDKRIRAGVLKLFEADSYLMLDPDWLRAGASIGIDKSYDFKVAALSLAAYVSGAAEVSWAPQHLAGELQLLGRIEISVAKFDFGLSLEADIGGKCPTPYEFLIDVKVKINLPWPLDDLELEVNLKWEETNEPSPIEPVLSQAWIRDYKTTNSWKLALVDDAHDDNDNETVYPVDSDNAIVEVPLDSRPVLIFDRSVKDLTAVGTPSPNVEAEVVGDKEFSYQLTSLVLQKWDAEASEWGEPLEIDGSWQATGEEGGTELELKGDGPFSFMRETVTMSTEQSGKWLGWTPYLDAFLSNYDSYPKDPLTYLAVRFNDYSTGSAGSTLVQDGVTISTAEGKDIVVHELLYNGQIIKAVKLAATDIRSLVIEFSSLVNPAALLLYFDVVDLPGPAKIGSIEVTGFTKDGSTTSVKLTGSAKPDWQLMFPDSSAFKNIEKLVLKGELVYFAWLIYSLSDEAYLAAEGSRLCSEQRYLFDKNSDYRIEAVTTTYVDSVAQPDVTQYAFFRSSGPPDDLTPYVDEIVLANGGNPHFRSYDIRVSFNENYVQELYGSGLTMRILDRNGKDAVDESGTSISPELSWSTGDVATAYYVDAWLEAIKDTGTTVECDDAETGVDIVVVSFRNASLPANQSLELRLEYEGYEGKLWSSFFVSSQYADFSSMISDFKDEPWITDLSADASFAFGATTDFDTAYYDLLNLAAKSRPERPELTLLRDSAKQARLLLLQFPEPLEWDRVTLAVKNESGREVIFVTIRSSDNCSFLLFKSGASGVDVWDSGKYDFQFKYALEKSGLPTLSRNGSANDEMPAARSIQIS